MDVVLTTVPQTALPVLAAEEETIEATAETTPEVEDTTEEPVVEDEESADVGEAENPKNSDVSEPTEGEMEGTEGDNKTPAIGGEDNSDENQVTEEMPDAEETEGSDVEEDSSISNAETDADEAEKLAAPEITVKQSGVAVADLEQALANRATEVTFEIKAVDGVAFKYTFGETAPTKDTGDAYSAPVAVAAPDQDGEGAVKINAIAVATPEGGEAQVSDVTTVTVKFAAKPADSAYKTISLSSESDFGSSASVWVYNGDNDGILTKDTPFSVTAPENGVYVTIDGKYDDLFEVMYLGEGGIWTSLKADKNGRYRIPDEVLDADQKNLELKVLSMRKITLYWGEGKDDWMEANGWDIVEIEATAMREQTDNSDNEIIFGDKVGEAYKGKIYAPKDTKVELTVRPRGDRQNVKLSKVTLWKSGDEAAKEQTIDETGASKFVVAEKIADDYELTIDGTVGYQSVVLGRRDEWSEKWEDVVPDKNGIYNVAPGKEYELSAYKAGYVELPIGKVTVTEDGAASDKIVAQEFYGGAGVWKLKVKADAGGKAFQVAFYAAAADAEPIDTLDIKVASAITEVKIAGEKNGTITQQIGTVAEYALTYDKNSKDDLRAAIKTGKTDDPYEYSNESVSEVRISSKGYLHVETSAAVKGKDKAAEIAIISGASGTEIKTVTLDTKNPSWDGSAAPTLKQAGATDVSLTVDITAPKGAVLDEFYESGVIYYYKVEVNEKSGTTKKVKYVRASGQTTRFEFKLNDKEIGEGEKADYEMTATLCLAAATFKDEDTAPEVTTSVATSKTSAILKHATRKPFYADKITLKKEKAASSLYTGQEACVATVDFGKNASYNSAADVEVIGDYPTDVFDDVYIDEDLKVWARTYSDATPGKYNIKVRTTYNKDLNNANSSIVQATASLPVTVVRGISEIDATAPKQIYMTDKGATAKIAVTYNYGRKDLAPKTKKANFELVYNWDWERPRTVPGITVDSKNGTIKIDKSYRLKNNSEENTYCVAVRAADYPDNEVVDYVTFEVTGKAASLGEVVIASEENGRYRDLAPTDGQQIAINEINDWNVKVIVVEKGAAKVGGKYLEDDLVDPGLYTLTAAKGTSVTCDKEDDTDETKTYSVNATKLGKNLVFKATATDGSKANVTSKRFEIVYDDHVTDKEVQVAYSKNATPRADGCLDDSKPNIDVPAGTLLRLSVADADGAMLYNEDENVSSVYDYTLSAKNAKVVKKYDGGLALDVIVIKNQAEITLKKGKRVLKTYKINIPDLDAKPAAPKVSLKKGAKIYSVDGYQELGFTMNQVVEGARYVEVSVQNNEGDTQTLFDSIDRYATLNAADKEFTFGLNLYGQELKKGASLAFVFCDRDGNALTKTSNTIKIKTTALKKSYKLNAKYTLSTKDAFSTPLTGKKSGVAPDGVKFTKLYNANFGGRVNEFRKGFKLTEDGRLELLITKDGKAVAETWTNKNNFTGFVEYTVTYVDGTEEKDVVSKIQVNLKKTDGKGIVPTANKYAASAVNVLNPTTGTVEGVSYVTAGKLPVDIRAAKIVYTTGSGKNAVSTLENKDSEVQVKKVSGNEITLTIKGDTRNKAYKGKIYVLPLTGMYGYDNEYLNREENTEENVQWWTTNGVELKYNVSLKAANSKGKIKSPAKSVSFLNVQPKKLAVDGRGKMYYYAELPYTVGIFAEIDDAQIGMETKKAAKDPKVFTEVKGLIKVRKVSNKNALGLYIDAEAFMEKVKNVKEGERSWSGVIFPQIEMTVPFAETNAVAEKITFSLTMPNPWDKLSANENRLSQIIKMINGVDVTVEGIAYSSYNAEDKTVVVTANDPDVSIRDAVDAKKDLMAETMLNDSDIDRWVSKLESITVKTNLDDAASAGRVIPNDGDNKAFLVKVIDKYTNGIIAELKEFGYTNPTWGDLNSHYKSIKLTITAALKATDKTEEERCTVRFVVDRDAVAGDTLDSAIARAVNRLSDESVIDESITGKYSALGRRITITGTDSELDFIDAKNRGRDKAVQILLSELGEYVDDVTELTFSYEESDGTLNFVTVKREGRETSEQYIANLVDKWTDKLVKKLNQIGYEGEGNPNTVGRLGGKSLFVEAKFKDEAVANVEYTIAFECEVKPTGLDAAIDSAVTELNKIRILGVEGIYYDSSNKAINIVGNNRDQEIIESKDSARDQTVRILLNEMGDYIEDVDEVTFSYTEPDGTSDFITVKKDGRDTTEKYVSGLVDKWTAKLADKLEAQGKPATYGSLDGKTLDVAVKYANGKVRTYTIHFTVY